MILSGSLGENRASFRLFSTPSIPYGYAALSSGYW